jgi:hypothetical protein
MFIRRDEMTMVRRLVDHMGEVGRGYTTTEQYVGTTEHVRATVCEIDLDHWYSENLDGHSTGYSVLSPDWFVFYDREGRPQVRGDRQRFISELTLIRLSGALDG